MTVDNEKKAFIEKNLDDLYRLWLKRAAVWGAVVFISLSGLDYASTPENFKLFFTYRIIIALLLLAVAAISSAFKERAMIFHTLLGHLAVIGSAITIELMVLKFGGHVSTYYVGQILLGVCVFGFIAARISFHVITALLIYLIYLVPILIFDEITDFRTFFTANVFIVAVFVSSVFLKYLNVKSLVRELGLRYEIDLQSRRLETEVQERTRALSDAVHDLEIEVAERTKAEASLEEAIKQKDDFLTRVGHDLKSPITPMVALLPLLIERETDPKQKELLDVCIKNVNNMKELVIKTMKHARVTSAYRVLNMESMELKKEVDGYIRKREDLLKEKNISVENRIGTGIGINADRTDMEELFYNLLSNSMKYTPDGGSIVIDASAGKDEVTVSIADTGVGLEGEQARNIFNEFYKVDESRHELDYSGLGLSICRNIVRNHGGIIRAESEGKGRGTKITFTIKKAALREEVPS